MSLLQTVKSVNILTVDNINDYYDVSLKEWRLQQIESEATSTYEESNLSSLRDISDVGLVNQIFADFKPDIVVNLAAQALELEIQLLIQMPTLRVILLGLTIF